MECENVERARRRRTPLRLEESAQVRFDSPGTCEPQAPPSCLSDFGGLAVEKRHCLFGGIRPLTLGLGQYDGENVGYFWLARSHAAQQIDC